jgi:ABC-2 type transport system ATP-binding protein
VLASTYLDDAERCTSALVLDAGLALASGTPEQIIAAMPGTLREVAAKPDGAAAARSWRRGGRWRVWDPGQRAGAGTGLIEPDLQDAVTVAALGQLLSAGAS